MNTEKNILENIQNFLFGRKKYVLYYTGSIQRIKIPKSTSCIVSLQAAGGGGSIGGIDDNHIHYSGGSGGAGGCIQNVPINVDENMLISVYIGRGKIGEDGEPSFIELQYKNGQKRRITVEGGKCAYGINGGLGGKSPYSSKLYGENGQDGIRQLPSCDILRGVSGAPSLYSTGGFGAYEGNNLNTQGLNGTLGSGGGSSSSDKDTPTKGGDGFAILLFN
jgi:hypothetical protein